MKQKNLSLKEFKILTSKIIKEEINKILNENSDYNVYLKAAELLVDENYDDAFNVLNGILQYEIEKDIEKSNEYPENINYNEDAMINFFVENVFLNDDKTGEPRLEQALYEAISKKQNLNLENDYSIISDKVVDIENNITNIWSEKFKNLVETTVNAFLENDDEYVTRSSKDYRNQQSINDYEAGTINKYGRKI